MLTPTALKDLLLYDPEAGVFFWKAQLGTKGLRSDLLGKLAGWQGSRGYWDIQIDGQSYRGHRLAWLYVYGRWPKGQIDHINRIKTDNRIVNLREASQPQNSANSKARKSRSGLKGAYWHSRDKKWSSAVGCGWGKIWLGNFATAEEAHAAYCEAAKKMHGEFFNSGKSK